MEQRLRVGEMSLSRSRYSAPRRALVAAMLAATLPLSAGVPHAAGIEAAAAHPGGAAPAAAGVPRIARGFAFHPVAPSRIADSRTGKGIARLVAGKPASLQVTGTAGIPAGATAVEANVTVVRATGSGYVSATPLRMTPAMVATSTVNFAAGEIAASGTTAPLSKDGHLWLLYMGARATDATDVVIDVTGYYGDPVGLTFHPLAPTRLPGNGTAGIALRSGTRTTLAVRGMAGIPTTASAVTGTLTVRAASRAGFVTVGPSSPAPATPSTSSVNVSPVQARSNGVTTALGPDGMLSITYIGATPADSALATFDVTGYFAPDAGGVVLHPLGPARVADSRSGRGRLVRLRSGVPVAFSLAGMVGVPASAAAVTGTLTAILPSRAGRISLTPVRPAGAPPTVSISFGAGEIRAAGVTAPLSATGALWLTYTGSAAGDTVDALLDITGFLGPQTAPNAVPSLYFRGWMPSDSWVTDANGVIVVDYGGSLGRQYNPQQVAGAAISYYNRWQFTDESEPERAADAAAFYTQLEWLVKNQTPDGRWLYTFPWGAQQIPWWSAIDEGTAISALIRGYALTGDARYLTAATRARTTFERPPEAAGVTSSTSLGGRSYLVYEEYLRGQEQRVLNGWMFGIVGLYEAAVYLNDQAAWVDVLAADRGTSAVAALLPYYDTGAWSLYSVNTLTGSPRGPRANLGYHNIHIGQLKYLGAVTGDAVLTRYGARFQAYVDACQASNTCRQTVWNPDGEPVADPFRLPEP